MSMLYHLAVSLVMLSAVQVMSGSLELDQEDASANIGSNGELQMAEDMDGDASSLDVYPFKVAPKKVVRAAPKVPFKVSHKTCTSRPQSWVAASVANFDNKGAGTVPMPQSCPMNHESTPLGDMKKCECGSEAECTSWSSGLSSNQKLAIGAAIEAAGGALKSKLPCNAFKTDQACGLDASRAARSAPSITKKHVASAPSYTNKFKPRTHSIVRRASLAETSDTKDCVDPATEDPESWMCECWDFAADQCQGVDEECIKRLMCESPNVCQSWKNDQSCPTGSMLLQRANGTDQMLKRSQSNSKTAGTSVDRSTVAKCDAENR